MKATRISKPALYQPKPLRQVELAKLLEWYQSRQRVLPWRTDASGYRVWVSEIMLQQTQVTTVIPFFNQFIERFPDVKSLAMAKESQVLASWSGLGYYSRARNLHQSAQIITSEYDGEFPKTREALLALPGIGPYTVGAIRSIAFSEPEPLLDGNVERVVGRLFAIDKDDHKRTNHWAASTYIMKFLSKRGFDPSDINQSLMEFGALHCTQRSPQCVGCPLQKTCKAFSIDCVENFPIKKVRPKKVKLTETRYLIRNRKNQILVRISLADRWRKGCFDLPLLSELGENFSVAGNSKPNKKIIIKLVVTNHEISRKIIQWSGSVRAPQNRPQIKFRWVSRSEIDENEIPVGAPLKKSIRAFL